MTTREPLNKTRDYGYGSHDVWLLLEEQPPKTLGWASDVTRYGHLTLEAVALREDARHTSPIDTRPSCGLDRFAITMQCDSEKGFTHAYGERWGFKPEYSNSPMVLTEMEDALPVVRMVERKLAAVREKYGEPGTFGQLVARICEALGVGMLVRNAHHEYGYQKVRRGNDIVWQVDQILHRWDREAAEKVTA